MSIAFQASYLILEPTTPSSVPNNAVFIDSTNGNALSNKDSSGNLTPIGGGSSGTNYFTKVMQTDALFSANVPLAKEPNGRVIEASAHAISSRNFIGYALQASTVVGQSITVLCVGPNLVGALTGLGFTPGDIILLSESGGYTNNSSTLSDSDDFIQAGIADCPGGPTASSTATDLITFPEFVARGNQ